MNSLQKMAFAEFYETIEPTVDRLVANAAFKKSVEALNVELVAKSMQAFSQNVREYNAFHRRERRLWAVKLTRGRVDAKLETDLKNDAVQARTSLESAFSGIFAVSREFKRCGLAAVAGKYSSDIFPVVAQSQYMERLFASLGCSSEMILEFRRNYGLIGYDFFASGTTWDEVEKLSRKGLKAQVEILDYTASKGLQYIRGRCGPPEWAIIVSKILASAGIAISAWAIVGIVVGLLALLVTICVASRHGSWLRRQCNRLEVLLPIFEF